MQRRSFFALILASGLLLAPGDPRVTTRSGSLPASLSDHDFWQLIVDASEPSGYFRSPNLTSNELEFQYVIPDLIRRARPTGVYLGVGPEQNFTYIAALRPSMAVIFDIRRGNLLLHLMYKALFEMAGDRADFVSLLFSRPRPPGLGPDSTVTELMSRFASVPGSHDAYAANLKAIEEQLTKVHRLSMGTNDREAIAHVYEAFYASGFRVRYSPTYDELMTATDDRGAHRSYLSTEARFRYLKDLHARNLIVPVVGDFGGPKAIRRVGVYLKAHNALVSAFYLSNVEQYLDGKARDFCRNVQSLPIDATSTFIRSSSRDPSGYGQGFVSSLGEMAAEVRGCGNGP